MLIFPISFWKKIQKLWKRMVNILTIPHQYLRENNLGMKILYFWRQRPKFCGDSFYPLHREFTQNKILKHIKQVYLNMKAPMNLWNTDNLGKSHPLRILIIPHDMLSCSFQVCFQNLFDDTIKSKFLKMNHHWKIFRFLIGVFFLDLKYNMLRLIDKWLIISVFLPKSLRSTFSLAISYNICHVKLRQIGI